METEPTLVVVTGPPAGGKSTVASELARRTPLPLLAKDTLKEILFDTFGWSDRAWSRRLGVATYPLLYATARALLARGRSLVLEANFDHERARRELLRLPARRFVQVHCSADPDVLIARFEARARSGARHPAHGELDAELIERIRGEEFGPIDLPGPCFRVVTDRFEDVSLGDITAVMPAPDRNGGPPALVVVSGPPASGKTEVAEKLAEELKIPFVTKDTFKEELYEVFGRDSEEPGTNPHEERIEKAALKILFSVLDMQLEAGVSVVGESDFHAGTHVEPFRRLCERHDVRIVQVHMDGDTDAIVERFVRRAESGDRHPGHADGANDADDLRQQLESGRWNALEIPGALVEADMSEDVASVAARVRAVLEG